MSAKIPSGPPGSAPVDDVAEAAETAGEVVEGRAPSEVIGSDAVTRVAEELAAGRISGDEAVERVLAETLGSSMVAQAPAELRAELAAALRTLIDSDPHLRSLARALGARDD